MQYGERYNVVSSVASSQRDRVSVTKDVRRVGSVDDVNYQSMSKHRECGSTRSSRHGSVSSVTDGRIRKTGTVKADPIDALEAVSSRS